MALYVFVQSRQSVSHVMQLKAAFLAVQHLCGLSGFGWDDGLKMVTATEEVWDAYILVSFIFASNLSGIYITAGQTHESAKKWQKTPFPLYDDMHYLVAGIVATGAGAFHAGAVPATSQIQTQSENASQTPVTPVRRARGHSEDQGSSEVHNLLI
jgi:hypothetical protein